MGTIDTEFADQLFSFMAFKYQIVPERNRVEDYPWSSDRFSANIGHAVMMLSYTYRPAFRGHFINVVQLINSFKKFAKWYAIIFASVTYKCHSPLKILVICSFISEMYLFIYFQSAPGNACRRYTLACTNCFNSIYKSVLSKIDGPIPKWNDVMHTASLVAQGYSILEPIMNTEHPSQNKLFFDSVAEVLEAERKYYVQKDLPECTETTNEPSTSANTSNLSTTNAKCIAASQRLRSKFATARNTKESISQASSTNASVSIGNASQIGDPSKRQGKKELSLQWSKPKDIKSNIPKNKAKASTDDAKFPVQTLPKSGASVGATASEATTSASGIDERLTYAFSFGTVDQITSKIPGFNEQKAAVLEYDHLKEKN